MDEKRERLDFLEDIGLSIVAIAFWAAVCFALVYFFPSAVWLWFLFIIYAALTLLETLFDFGAIKIVRWILRPRPKPKRSHSPSRDD